MRGSRAREWSKIFVDSSLVDANASNNSVIDTKNLKHQVRKNYKKLEARLEETSESADSARGYEKKNSRYMSTTDPDAAIVNRGKAKLTYQVHRAVDGKAEIITATDATSGDVNEAHLMLPLLEKWVTHQQGLRLKPLLPTASTAPSIIFWPVTTRDYRLIFLIYGKRRSRGRQNEKFFPKTIFSITRILTDTVVQRTICSSQNRCT